MLFRIALAAVFAVSMSLTSLAESLKLDKEKSKLEFVGSKPPKDGKVDSHTGGFKEFKADAKANLEEPSKSSLNLEIKTDSLFSDNPMLTAHLKNPDFFDVKKFPTIKFETSKVEPSEKKSEGTMTGKLTLLGKTEELEVPYTVEVTDQGINLVADFQLDRTKWGMNYGVPNVNALVDIKATFVFKK